jgi:protein-disulfide isomerase-like protein with CxxC motif
MELPFRLALQLCPGSNHVSDSVDLDFYFDPACGWAWRTSLWIREVASLRPINVTWKLVSLGVINAPADWRVGTSANQVRGGKMVRTLIRAQQVGGNDAVNRLFISYGNAMHGRGDDMNELDVQKRCLEDAGLSTELFEEAQADPAIETQMVDITREAMTDLELFGVPTLVLKGSKVAVFGPVIHPVPTGDAALELWDYTYFSLKQPYLYELKRTRAKYDAPQFADAQGLPAAAPALA